ncbi:MAG TPA: hypothetical protein VGR57_21635 [Ktedonobacterales bacterium]|nr:hypothetical protein [Ktedonobacterales bacterium]
MAWNERLRAAWRGEVSGADIAALFAATGRLSTLRQSLADARLAADIDATGHEWRAPLAVGPIAAPLWLADALVALAGAFYDSATPTHAAGLPPATHDLVAALLAPVEELIVAVTAAVADPARHVVLDAPVRVGPGGDIAGAAPPRLPSPAYTRDLATGAVRVHTSAAALLAPLRATFDRAAPPDWLAAGAQRQDGILQAAGARLEMAQVHLGGLATAPGEASALGTVCRDLWDVIDSAIHAGQLLADPHLMPEAAAVPRPGVPVPAPPSPARGSAGGDVTPPAPPIPPRRPAPIVHVTLPTIAEGAPAPRPQDASPPPAPAPQPAALPNQALPNQALPTIGPEPPAPPPAPHPKAPPATPPPARPNAPQPGAPHAPGPEEPPPFAFPKIGD